MSVANPYQIRAATTADLDAVAELARFLNTVNLPDDPAAIRDVLELSEASFAGRVSDPNRAEYTFVLEDTRTGRVVGSSAVIGQLGRRDAPYIYLDVREQERYSATLDKHFVHQVLNIGFSYDGSTELGRLVVDPGLRSGPHRLGTMISCVRFGWIAMRRELFQDEVLAELLPPLEPDGTSHLWEAVGRHFTGLSYRDADQLSRRNKEFIRGLFPSGDIYVSLLPPKAQRVVGQVGRQTRGVEHLLRRIGFRYAQRVDPFDGGPHFVAPTDQISLVQAAEPRYALLAREDGTVPSALAFGSWPDPPYFLALPALLADDPAAVSLHQSHAAKLGISAGEPVWSLPLRTPART